MEALPIPNHEASTVAEKLVDDVFLRSSPPEQLYTDQGQQFESKLISEVYLMFGWQAQLPIDLIYGTGIQEGESHSVGEYVASLKTKMSTAFDIVRKSISKHHVYQKELYDQKVHGQLFEAGDWV